MGAINSAVAASPETVSILLTYGPLGIILAWFMLRAEQKLERIPQELRTLGHRLDGLTRALLADVISRDEGDHKAKDIAQKMLSEIEARESSPRPPVGGFFGRD